MTRGKPLLFQRDTGGRARLARKRAAESAFQAGRLPKNPPAELSGAAARAAWRAALRAHSHLPSQLFNELDRSFLIGYCLAVQARADALDLAADLGKKYKAGEEKLPALIKARAELRMATRLVSDLEKQLYMTPKARAGVNPPPPEQTEPAKPLPPGAYAWGDLVKEWENKRNE
jgi:hypothetical protein